MQVCHIDVFTNITPCAAEYPQDIRQWLREKTHKVLALNLHPSGAEDVFRWTTYHYSVAKII